MFFYITNRSRKSISGHTKLLKPLPAELHGRKCLALDLDETLVHSSFQPVENADFIIPVVIEDTTHHVYVLKRPGVDEFMRRMGKIYEIVVYTASLSKYANPLLDKLDIHDVIHARLFREHCVYFQGHYVKDMSLLNRPINECIIVDNSPMSYAFHPENAIGCGSYIDCPTDIEMWQLADFLENLNNTDDVRGKTRLWRQWCSKNPSSVPK
jgi:RNA polymerase II subunit A small phosphatase-like protein